MSLVVLPGATLTSTISAANISYSSGEIAGADRQCLISVGAQKFVWIEGNLDGSQEAVMVTGTSHSRIHRVTVVNATDDVVWLNGASHSNYVTQITAVGGADGIFMGYDGFPSYNTIDGLNAKGNGYTGLTVYTGMYGIYRNLRVANAASHGVQVNTLYNVFSNINTSNNGGHGIYVAAQENFFTNILAVGNSGSGIQLNTAGGGYSSVGTFISQATFAGNAVKGLNIEHAVELSNVLAVKNAVGVRFNNASSVHSLAVMDSTAQDIIQDAPTAAPIFLGNLLVTNNTTSCAENFGLTNGVTPNTCVPRGTSTATAFYQGSALASFVGALSTSDTANTSDTSGTSSYPGTPNSFDWLQFDSPFRLWGIWNNTIRWTSGTGAILDFRLLSAGTKIYKNTMAVSTSNGNFTAGAACPAAVNGNVTSTYDFTPMSVTPVFTYLTHAVEIIDPASTGYSTTGNHNGMCESNDSCLYLPNFGAYQGEGSLGTCTFNANGGPVTGVTIRGYLTNGQ